MRQISLLLLVFTTLTTSISAQTNTGEWISNQDTVYQKWLKDSGLDSLLSVSSIFQENDSVYVDIEFSVSEDGLILPGWEQVKRDYEMMSPFTLEQKLFYRAVHVLGLPQESLRVRIRDSFDEFEINCFTREIFFGPEGVIVYEGSDNCNLRSKIRTLTWKGVPLDSFRRGSEKKVSGKLGKQELYDRIADFAKAKFEREVCDLRTPKVVIREKVNILRFQVYDLCKEVLTDEENPLICRVLRRTGYDCNWIKREMLSFTIIAQEFDGGFSLYCEIEGKYGSGLFDKVRKEGYVDMEVDFDEYLELYADKFVLELSERLN